MAENLIMLDHLVSAASMGANITSAVQSLQKQDNCGIQLIWTGTPTGTFGVQVSLDYQLGTGVGTWTQITLSPVPAASGAAGTYYIDLNQLSSPWIQITYTRTSGTGTLDAWISAKGV